MFEKEGIKYAIEETIGTECLSMPIEDFHFIDLSEEQQEKAQCFKDGAEVGYNKAKAEMKEQGLALQSDMDKTIEQNISLKEQIEKMKAELHHRLVSPSHDDSDCLDKIVGLDRLWQFGQEF